MGGYGGRMRKYLFGTGIISAVMTGGTLLKELRGDAPFTWRTALAWVSWGITIALAIGAIVDIRRASRGGLVAADSPVSNKAQKLAAKRLRD